MTRELERVAGELRAERRRLGVDAVAASHAHRVAVFERAPLERGDEPVQSGLDHPQRVAHRDALRGVDHVVGREPEVDVAAFLAARLLHLRDERRRLVGHLTIELEDALDVDARVATARVGRPGGDLADRLPRIERSKLDIEPALEPRFVRPQPSHLRTRVSRDHVRSFLSGTSTTSAAFSSGGKTG